MYQEFTAKLEDGTLALTGTFAPDFSGQALKFCKDIAELDGEQAHVKITLDVEKATARVEIHIAPKPKSIARGPDAPPSDIDAPSAGAELGDEMLADELEPAPSPKLSKSRKK